MSRFALAYAIALVASCSDAAPNASFNSDADRAVARYSLRSGITLTGGVTRLPDAIEISGTAPLADVEVCEDESRTCMVTGRDGWFALEGLTPETEILLVFNKAGYYPTIQAMESPRWSTTAITAALATSTINATRSTRSCARQAYLK